jgi:hypothetical protein
LEINVVRLYRPAAGEPDGPDVYLTRGQARAVISSGLAVLPALGISVTIGPQRAKTWLRSACRAGRRGGDG